MTDYLVRAETKEAWDAYAFQQGWRIEPDSDGQELARGVQVDEIGPVMLEPPVLDEAGNEIPPAVVDGWHHVNLRLPDDMPVDLPAARSVTTSPKGIGAREVGESPARVQFLDASDIATPIRVWMDGMNFEPAGASDDGL